MILHKLKLIPNEAFNASKELAFMAKAELVKDRLVIVNRTIAKLVLFRAYNFKASNNQKDSL